MSALSDSIELFINNLFSEAEEDEIAIRRNELAQYFACAPSQINYVLSTRFTPDKGYLIVSRRGGGGFVRVIRVNLDRSELLSDLLVNYVGSAISSRNALSLIARLQRENIITPHEATLVGILIHDPGVQDPSQQDFARARMMKNLLITLLKEE